MKTILKNHKKISNTKIYTEETAMATAEYAIVMLAAAGFAGLLVTLLRSEEVRSFLLSIVQNALTLG